MEVTERILYIEDDPGLARLLQKRLTREGYTVELVPDGPAAVELGAAQHWDLIILDYNIPGLPGIEVLRELSRRGTVPPSIMLTGAGNEEIAVEAMKLGAADYIIKDVEMTYLELLPMVVRQVFHKSRLQREKDELFATVQENEERYRLLVNLSPEGIIVHCGGRFLFVNPAGARILGGDPERFIAQELLSFVHPEYHELVGEGLAATSSGARTPWVEAELVRDDGAVVEVEFSGVPFTYQGLPAVQMVFRDITERKSIEKRLRFMAMFDQLTELPNRVLLDDRLRQLVFHGEEKGVAFALLFIDLDRFKEINDNFGHDAGDAVLRETGKRLLEAIRRSDTAARVGGDEFVVLLANSLDPPGIAGVARRIISMLSEPVLFEGVAHRVGASIGISTYPADGRDGDLLLQRADEAMYRVKQRGRNGFCFFGADPDESAEVQPV